MNVIVLLDICSVLSFGVAFFYVYFIRKDTIYYQARFLLYILLGIYLLVGLTNIMEHGGLTAFFDPYEEYLEALFIPFFLFFMYTLIAALDMEKLKAGENELKKALERAESERRKSNAILAAIGDGISIQDRNLKILYQNDVLKKMVGDHVGEYCYEIYEQRSQPCRQGCPIRASFQDGKVHKTERTVVADHSMIEVEITASPLINQQGEVYAGIEVVRDITDRKRMTAEIIRAQKLESIGLLAGGIAHDFNNLLAALLGNISLAKTYTYAKSQNKIIAKLDAAEKASLRARELTQQLLIFARGGTPVKKVMNINELVRESSLFSQQSSKVSCDFDLADDLWPVEVDDGQLNQVVTNLIINAEQAMPGGGCIKVSTENVSLAPDNPMLLTPGRYIRITFADHGHGIDARDLPRIFDPFYTTKREGSGLGLATSFSIIKNHGGNIMVESVLGHGAKFLVYLPATEVKADEAPAEEESLFAGQGRVLVMDDEATIRDLAEEMLVHLGYEVVATSSGEEAVAAYRSALKENRPIAAAILDLTVPGGMGGREAGEAILALDPAAKILLSSGYTDNQAIAYYQQKGFSGIVPKPYKIQELSKNVHDILPPAAENKVTLNETQPK